MSPSVRISRRAAETLLSWCQEPAFHASPGVDRYVEAELRHALAPKRAVVARAKRTAKKKRTKSQETKAIRAEVFARARGQCESCGWIFTELSPGELDHFAGRRVAQSAGGCWALCRDCHRAKTRNDPSAKAWLERFVAHGYAHGYSDGRKRALRRLDALRLVEQAAAVSATANGARP